MIIVTSLDSYLLLLLWETEALHGCMNYLCLPREQNKDQISAFRIPSCSLTQHSLSGKTAWESCPCLMEGMAKGQNHLFDNQDACELLSIVLAAS